jgi:Glycosyltransferase family 25 (LPS biosynthesis protein)
MTVLWINAKADANRRDWFIHNNVRRWPTVRWLHQQAIALGNRLGCWLSHSLVWDRIANNDNLPSGPIAIMEDDARLLRLPDKDELRVADHEILYLGSPTLNGRYNAGTWAYSINHVTADWLLSNPSLAYQGIRMPIDHALGTIAALSRRHIAHPLVEHCGHALPPSIIYPQ